VFNNIHTYINEGNLYHGLEICEHHGKINYHVLELKRKKQELILQREETYADFEQVVGFLKKDIPLFLVLNTAKVITKIRPLTIDTGEEALVHGAFPNLDFDTFYYTLVKSNSNSIISVCKKDYLDSFLKKISELSIGILDISLGISSITSVVQYLGGEEILVSNGKLILQENSIQRFTPSSESENYGPSYFELNGIQISNLSLLSFSAIVGHLFGSNASKNNFEGILIDLRKGFRNKRFFNLISKSSIAFILTLLLINFFVFNRYYDKVNKIQEKLEVNTINSKRITDLKTEINDKEEKLNAVLLASNSKSSLYLDGIARSVPSSILLSEIQYQPLAKTIRDKKTILVSNNILIISGDVSNSVDFYDWITELEKLAWVEKVETTNYEFGKGSISHFSIKLSINE